MMRRLLRFRNLSAFQIILCGFAAVILLGTILLMLPLSSADGAACTPSDALFTATSAVCVTGLVVKDTWSAWSGFGQAVILILIQTGGMGVVLVVSSVYLLTGRRIGLKQRSTVQDAISAQQSGGIIRLVLMILLILFLTEAAGAILLCPVFCRDFGMAKGIWFSVFHSVSAMCNAGFDLLGEKGAYSSLSFYAASPAVLLVIAALIIWGGLGFLTWRDIFLQRRKLSRYSLQARLVLCMTAILIAVPMILFFFLEFKKGSVEERLLSSFFTAVTPRTAGFASVDMNLLSESGRVLTYRYITQQIWGSSWDNNLATLRVMMNSLRRKLCCGQEKEPMIQTHVGIGYRLLKT